MNNFHKILDDEFKKIATTSEAPDNAIADADVIEVMNKSY